MFKALCSTKTLSLPGNLIHFFFLLWDFLCSGSNNKAEKSLFLLLLKRPILCVSWVFQTLIIQLAGSRGQWCSRVHWYTGRRDCDAGNDSRWFARKRRCVLFNIHTLWDSPINDPGSLCIYHSFPWSQPGQCINSDILLLRLIENPDAYVHNIYGYFLLCVVS